ncbi:hypothetical protein OXPF_30750 [Oxobacter pfennigii]|uniref:Zinc-ribbon 15 domain-containing protein n=1 Tax=Oxobacter pfennigii TaxID=36849 RepID=A0A0P8W6J1_9CLOT|nr:zinc ribbon domain-containing protein [Oxobacter pfennigii]KPU43633.1 hypothetical protein OXPF_30750 [Oxobacter pfennigii]
MFFIGIFGIQNKVKELKEFTDVCCSCGKYSRMKLLYEYNCFHIFFLPLFKWGRKYFLEARCCRRVFEVPDNYIDELLEADTVDFSRLTEINMPYTLCPNCRNYVDSGYKFCPNCGSKLKL